MIKAGIVGGTGYTAGELIRILLFHPEVDIDFIFSTSKAGEAVAETHEDLTGSTNLVFTNTVNSKIDVLFLCLGHGNSKTFLEKYTFASHTKVIDLSNDFRLKKDTHFKGKDFVYGLPELYKESIKKASYIANPGCFATAIQLGLLPLAAAKKLKNEVHINAITGSTGAGAGLSATSHFSWRNNNISWYKPFTHQHLGEIGESIESLQQKEADLIFMPQRGNFTRGIFATSYTKFKGSIDEAYQLFMSFYREAAFTHLSKKEIHLKQLVNTNNCHIHLHKHNDLLLITSAIDNLIKGASGQAVHNMNLMFGFDEKTGLQLKGSYF